MATRAQLVTWLRRRLQEVSAAQWTDGNLIDYINEGYRELSQAISSVDPEWLMFQDSHDITKDEARYKFPTNMETLIEVWYTSSTGGTYSRLDFRRRRSQDNDPSGLPGTAVSYSTKGKYLVVRPTPSAAITKGIRIDYVPVASLGDATSVPEFSASLHRGIVLSAQLIALGDTSETTDKTETQTELDRFLVRAQQAYDTNRDEDEFLSPDGDLKLYPDGQA